MAKSFYRRFGRISCTLALISLPLLMYGAVRAYLTQYNNVADWLPRGSHAVEDLKWFVDRFGSDEILVVSWPGCTLDDERLDRFAVALEQPASVPGLGEPATLFRHVFTGKQTLAELTAPTTGLSRPEAIERMRGWLVGPDGRTTCAVALVTWAGATNRPAALDAVFRAAKGCGLDRKQLKIGGSTAETVAINQASQKWMLELGIITLLWGLLAAWFCLKSLRLVGIVFFTMSWAWSASLSLVYWTGTHMDAVLLMMPVLVYVLTISGAVHLANYYRDAAQQGREKEALDWSVAHGRLPCIFSCVTTMIGLGSLTVSQVVPIKRFGLFSSLSLLIVLLALLVLWPSAMHCWMRRDERRTAFIGGSSGPRNTAMAWWRPLCDLVTRRYTVLVVATFILLPLLFYGASRIRTSARLEDLLPPEAPLMQGYEWLQDHIGPLVPVEVVLRFPARDPQDSLQLLERLETVEQLRRRIDGMKHVGGTVAASSFVREIPQGQGFRQIARRRVVAKRIQDNLQQFVQMKYLNHDPDHHEEIWRISTRIEAFKNVDYGKFLKRLKQQVDDVLASRREAHEGQVTSLVCGGAPLVYMAQEQLLRDLFKSFVTAFVMITIAMILITRSLVAGLLVMVPNVFPTVAIFGGLGMLQTPVGIGVIMTASAAMGIAVDDTLHFLVWFRRGLDSGSNRRQAVRFAFEHCATAMLQTTLICGLGMLVFALSPFVPMMRFAEFMALLLLAALAGDLVLLPAVLISPLGNWFESNRSVAR